YSYTNEDTINFFESQGIELKGERGGRVFPESDKSSDIIKGFLNELKNNKIDIKLNSKVTKVNFKGKKIISVEVNNKDLIEGDSFIIATGGISYPLTGSTGDGYRFAKALGHNIIELTPSLVPIEIKNKFPIETIGVNLKNIELKLYENNSKKPRFNEIGEVLITNYGISGPLSLKVSNLINTKENYYIIIDLKPALTLEALDKRIQKDFSKNINKEFKNSLDELLPKKLINYIITSSKINEDKIVNEITKEERKYLGYIIKNIQLEFDRLRPIKEAIVTSGGIDTKEIDPSTMKSKLINNLLFAGEIIDVDAYTGGYNVQIAISTGYLAGNNI
uniref:NAD(P)/FAD-dependent oxidoreductase n=1 Tax=Clostridium sp. TaxID=1506 RepID=UPI00261D1CB8